MRRRSAIVGLTLALALHPKLAPAQWIEMKSPHFVITSNASQSSTRTLLWQLEQVRSAIGALFTWARVDPDQPIVVIAVKDERGMRALAPKYWEQKGGMRPASVWVTGADGHYLAIRSDLQAEDRDTINPYVNAYYSYVSLILQQSLDRDLPLWFTRGFAGVLSNTIVRDTHILFGPPIPWHLEQLRDGARLPLSALMSVTRTSPELARGDGLSRFDAQSWALVHFLMFGDRGVRRPTLNRFATLIASGSDPATAVRESLGKLEDLERDLHFYINRSLYTFLQVTVDASVERERVPARPLAPTDVAAAHALFHVAMNRPADARAAIEQARRADPAPADSFLAEALMFDREGNSDAARAAFQQAVDRGSASAYAHYRLAALRWRPQPDRDTLAEIEKLLLKTVALNNRHDAAYAYLGEVRSLLGNPEAAGLVRRAISLAPTKARHHLTAAGVLMRAKVPDEALKEARAALSLAQDAESRNAAEAMIRSIEQAPSVRPSDPTPAQKPVAPPATAEPVRVGGGVLPPRVLEEVKAGYSAEAVRMRIEGILHYDVVVRADGRVERTELTKCDVKSRLQDSTSERDAKPRDALLQSRFKAGSCDETFGLSAEGARALEQWRFLPGTRDGNAIPVIVEVQMTFTLK